MPAYIIRLIAVLFILLLSSLALSTEDEKIKVAVIDTGLNKYLFKHKNICKEGHVNFLNFKELPYDSHGHGTNISGLIDDYASGANYCQIILKYYGPQTFGSMFKFLWRRLKGERQPNTTNLWRMISSIEKAIELNVDFINISGGGEQPQKYERKAVLKALDKGIIIVAAAGNDSYSLDKYGYYPASYDKRIVVAGSTNRKGGKLSSSNHGSIVDYWEQGLRMCPTWGWIQSGGRKSSLCMSGTSQATAITTGKLINQLWNDRKPAILNEEQMKNER